MFDPGDAAIPRRDQVDLAFPYCLGVILLSEPNVFNRLSSPPHGRLSFLRPTFQSARFNWRLGRISRLPAALLSALSDRLSIRGLSPCGKSNFPT